MKQPRKSVLTLLLLALLFLLPGITAYWLFMHPQWLTAGKTNKGKLLHPPYQLNEASNENKWHLYYWHPGQCDAGCLRYLDQLARVRLALGRKLYEVDLQWLRASNSPMIDAKLQSELREQDIRMKVLNDKDSQYFFETSNNNRVYIADSKDFLILAYPESDMFLDVYSDLKHLLSIPVSKEESNA